ncbi:hypothetical protein ACQEWB_25690 [Streptomyces sp. CA-249302]|uniref:hypothetical protein n=1 Tax=Streptomyces sp. CA-249302 TaxID=3240058 RepID=UPI003D8EB00E
MARLGHRCALMARLADNAFGRILRAHTTAEGIDLAYVSAATEPTTPADVSMDAEGQASYAFYLEGTASTWRAPQTGSGRRSRPPTFPRRPPYRTSTRSPPGHHRPVSASMPPFDGCAPVVRH